MAAPTDFEIFNRCSAMGISPQMLVSRLTVRATICPECGAGSSQKCKNSRGKDRESNHLSRVMDSIRSNWDHLDGGQ